MPIPEHYRWLLAEGAPRLLVQALELYGIEEVPGPRHNPQILGWLKEIGFSWIKDDETPWCGTALAVAAVRAGVAAPHPEMPRAFWWTRWGRGVAMPMLGDVLVFETSHVGIYIGEDSTHYHVLGGNQNNRHGIDRFRKTLLQTARRTRWQIAQPANVRRVWLTPRGAVAAVSTR